MSRPLNRIASVLLTVRGWGRSSVARALNWLEWHELRSGGIRVHSKHANAYPEVTGYLVPTLFDYGREEQALRLVAWLLSVQQRDGSFADPDFGRPYPFDTGQVLRGFLRALDHLSGVEDACRRACEYLCSQMIREGRGGFVRQYDDCRGAVPESIHLYALPPLIEAGQRLRESKYSDFARQCHAFYCAQADAFQSNTLTHFLAYELDAALDLGMTDASRSCLEILRQRQTLQGGVSGIPHANWVCVPALGQLALCWHKAGQLEAASRALACMEALQRPSGGFRGSEGVGANYFSEVELSWAVKYYLDARLLFSKEEKGKR